MENYSYMDVITKLTYVHTPTPTNRIILYVLFSGLLLFLRHCGQLQIFILSGYRVFSCVEIIQPIF